eukprot:sb/3478689/
MWHMEAKVLLHKYIPSQVSQKSHGVTSATTTIESGGGVVDGTGPSNDIISLRSDSRLGAALSHMRTSSLHRAEGPVRPRLKIAWYTVSVGQELLQLRFK